MPGRCQVYPQPSAPDDHTAAAQFEIYCKQLSRQKKQALLASPGDWATFFPKLDTQRYKPCTPEPLSYYLGI